MVTDLLKSRVAEDALLGATSGPAVSLSSFSKFSADESPQAFLAKFEAEADAMRVPSARFLSIFPSMMTGPKATACVT